MTSDFQIKPLVPSQNNSTTELPYEFQTDSTKNTVSNQTAIVQNTNELPYEFQIESGATNTVGQTQEQQTPISHDASEIPYEFQTDSNSTINIQSSTNLDSLIKNEDSASTTTQSILENSKQTVLSKKTTIKQSKLSSSNINAIPSNTTSDPQINTKITSPTNLDNTLQDNPNMNEDVSANTIENISQGDFDVDLITKKLQDILKSPSPITLFQKSTELKEDFANFINYIVKKIAVGFNTQNKEVVLSMYYNAKYEKVWIENLKNYIDDLKYIDVNLYFQILLILQKKQQNLARLLIKIYRKEKKEVIAKFVSKYCSGINLEDVYKKYELLGIEHLVGIIDNSNIDENKPNLFLYEIYLNNELSRDVLFYLFSFSREEVTNRFSDIYSIFSLIATHYLNDLAYKDRQISFYLNYKKNQSTIKSLDILIDTYLDNKETFYIKAEEVLGSRGPIEKSYFSLYIKTQIINKYYNEVKRLFYWDKQVCSNRSEWSNLKGNFIYSDKSQFIQGVKEILSFKKLILELSSNTLSPFLKPFIYSIVSEKLSVTKKELLKIRYLMTLILSENYTEYKKIYNFFEDLETFMDYNIDSTLSRISFNFKKIKIFAADFIVGFFGLLWLYFYAPVGVFLGCLILVLSYLREHFTSFKSGIEWNLGIRTFATVILVISGFYWITNLDATKLDVAKLTNKVEKLGVYKTDQAFQVVNKKVGDLKIEESVANILQFNKNK